MTGVLTTIIVLLFAGIVLIYTMYLHAEREKVNTKLKVFLSPGFTPWKVDKQVIEKQPDKVDTLELVLYEAPPNGRPLYPDLRNPRQVRVIVTNRVQAKHIADCDLDDEEGIIRAVAEGENLASFLNAHKVK